MNRPCIYIFSGLLVLMLMVQTAIAQEEEEEMQEEQILISQQDSLIIKKMPVLSSVSVLFDYGKLVGLVLDTESKYEIGGQVEFLNKLVVIGEYGIATLNPRGSYVNAAYVSEGSYYRVGLGYKIDMNEKNNFIFSLRYGSSTYSDQGEIQIHSASGIYDPLVQSFDRDDITAYWYEAVMSSEKRVWKGLYAGFHLRLRVMGDYDDQLPLDVFSIPGYGRTFDKTVPAFNLYIKYSLERF
ncbi:DUF6048 family protein [Reichenbachiella agarivorans]|uniref:DUF6048 family protein n=1 Tax=Reichenbachiella agarivorans TaxID=2979464 RepID=A0ABY6CL58_9BACT|nr:DUF6048 family protein [Reichenbachiella agarivorans]UXP31129.1 DUF6048 family protein [Reichenbachiella agarivorans]